MNNQLNPAEARPNQAHNLIEALARFEVYKTRQVSVLAKNGPNLGKRWQTLSILKIHPSRPKFIVLGKN